MKSPFVKYFPWPFILTIVLMVGGCIGEDAPSRAECAPGQTFNTVTRKCVNVRGAPKPILSSLVFTRGQAPEEFVIEYIDYEEKSAESCQVSMESPTSNRFSIRAPEYYLGPDQAMQAYEAALNARNAAVDPVLIADVVIALGEAENEMRNTYAARNTISLAESMRSTAREVRNVGEILQDDLTSTSRTLGLVAIAAADELDAMASRVASRCSCSGAVCRAVYDADYLFSGTGGFSYTIQDSVGISSPKSVDVIVQHVNYPPYPASFNVPSTWQESPTNTPETYSFEIPLPDGLDESLFWTYDLEVAPVNGQLLNCMGLNGSSPSDRFCDYRPHDGNAYGDFGDRASVQVGTFFRLEANSAGEWGNQIEVNIYENPIIRTGNINGSGGEDNVVIRVDGFKVDVWVDFTDEIAGGNSYSPTTVGDLLNALNNHPEVSQFLTASIVPPTIPSLGLAPIDWTLSLSGGTQSFDQFQYSVTGAQGKSVVNGHVAIGIEFTDNPPYPTLDLLSDSLIEDQEALIVLGYEKVQQVGTGRECDVSFGSAAQVIMTTPCVCELMDSTTIPELGPGQCGVKVIPQSGSAGSFSFQYNVFTDQFDQDGNIINLPGDYIGFIGGSHTVTGVINSAARPPLPFFFDARDSSTGQDPEESLNAFPLTYDLEPMTPAAFNFGGGLGGYTYRVVDSSFITDPDNPDFKGLFSQCISGDLSFNPSLNCHYTPRSGNDNSGDPDPDERYATRSVPWAELNFTARQRGDQSEHLSFSFHLGHNIDQGNEYIKVDYETPSLGNLEFKFYVGPDSTSADIVQAVLDHPYAHQLLEVGTTGAPVVLASVPDFSLDPVFLLLGDGPDHNGLDYFEYEILDSFGNVVSPFPGRVNIFVTDTPNEPLVCQYSSFDAAPECGITGCRGPNPPEYAVTPLSSGLVYFDHDANVCYKSNLNSSPVWEIIDSNIFSIETNERNELDFKHIILESGSLGGDLTLIDFSSSNTVLVPEEQISFSYNGSSVGEGATFSVSGSGASLGELEISLISSDGEDGVGETTINFTLENQEGIQVQTSFNVKINGVAASHNGWRNIRATGPTVTDQAGGNERIHAPRVCSFSQAQCEINGSRQDCKGSVNPQGYATALGSGAIYFNSATETCFRYGDVDGSDQWIEFSTYCNISPAAYNPTVCDQGVSCLGDNLPLNTGDLTQDNLYFYDYAENKCYRSAFDFSIPGYVWDEYKGTGETTLSWESFGVLGPGAISGYNVYRKVATDSNFDYRFPINREPIPTNIRTYTDNAINSIIAPVPRTVYHYEVRPIINNIPTSTQEYDSIVRVMVPPQNTAFVHRWMVNKATCEYLGRSISREEGPGKPGNYSCSYVGPGANADGFFDYGKDLIVDRFEAGCNYSRSPACTTSSGSCVGTQNPNDAGVLPTVPGDRAVFYNRSTGVCYIHTGINWVDMQNAIYRVTDLIQPDLLDNYQHRRSRVPALVNINQETAQEYCRLDHNDLEQIVGLGFGVLTFNSRLPNRMDQMAYSHWDRNTLSENEINDLQMGLSLNSTSKCNSSNADGLEHLFTNSETVVSGNAFTMSGTADSGIRSVITGSEQTKSCQNRFGIQDVVGNVAEWTTDRIQCRGVTLGYDSFAGDPLLDGQSMGLSTCDSEFDAAPADPLLLHQYSSPSLSVLTSYYLKFQVGGFREESFNVGPDGPCFDLNADGGCNRFITNWVIQDQSFAAGRWIAPLGLPANANFPLYFIDDPIIPDLLRIGPSNGITTQQLHGDRITLNTHHLFTDDDGQGGMATGGSYLSSQGGGRWSFEMLPRGEVDAYFAQVGEVALYHPSVRWFIQFLDNGPVTGTSSDVDCNTVDNIITVDIEDNVTAAIDVVRVINEAACSGVEAYLSGHPFTAQLETPSSLIPMARVQAANRGDDIGLRCLVDIDDSDYD